jgi:hypothetical protein
MSLGRMTFGQLSKYLENREDGPQPFCQKVTAVAATGHKHERRLIESDGRLVIVSESPKSSEDQKVLTLAEQFIAAMPERIKNETETTTEPMHLDSASPIHFDASQSDDLGIESMADELDLDFDFSLDER